jgi:hypothetical protein
MTNTGDKPYADINIARRLAGNFDPTDISDSEIITIIAFCDAMVESETARVGIGWSVNDASYPMIQNASNYFVASEIISRYNDETGKGDAHYEKAMDLCMSVRESSPGSLIIAAGTYRTFPLNPNAKIYRSLPGSSDASNRQAVFGSDDDTISP